MAKLPKVRPAQSTQGDSRPPQRDNRLPKTFERMLEQCAFTLDLLHKRFRH